VVIVFECISRPSFGMSLYLCLFLVWSLYRVHFLRPSDRLSLYRCHSLIVFRGCGVPVRSLRCRQIMQETIEARSFLGTRGYLAPEMLQRHTYDKAIDVWVREGYERYRL